MAFDKANGRLLAIANEWDRAEKVMKLAERVRAEAIYASVNELRYAGRRFVDALRAEHDPNGLEPDLETCCSEALQFCYRAQHDAVDATILFVQRALNEYESEFGLALLMQHFPSVAELRAKLHEVDDIVISSREDRLKRRATYNDIIDNQLPSIVEGYRLIHGNRSALEQLAADTLAAEQRREQAAEQERQAREDAEKRAANRFWTAQTIAIFAALGGALVSFILIKLFS